MPVVSVKISGMTCGSCTYKVECEVGDLEGVSAAKADFTAGTGEFILEDGAPTTAQNILDTINGLGFKAQLVCIRDPI